MKKRQTIKNCNNITHYMEYNESDSENLVIAEELFPIVGIGASAGGLEAMELFLKNVPDGSGMAFIIIMHHYPHNIGMIHEALQRSTNMAVFQVTDGLKVSPDCVYFIPPNKDISILHGVLYLLEPDAVNGFRMPVDYFFRSMAEDLQERSIGVILSGMGTDGTSGIRIIKEKTGLVLAQDPNDAKFDGMPCSAINSGMVDIIAAVPELPGRIISYIKHVHIVAKSRLALEDKEFSALEKIVILLRTHTGNDFSLYKSSTIYRRVERRMGIHRIDKINAYVRFLQGNPQELDILFRELLIGVTSFFRDSGVWEKLKKSLVSYLHGLQPSDRLMRAWVAGCSTGEEAYSLAILFKETIEQYKPKATISLQIFATDLDKDSIDKARQGLYTGNIAADLSPERLSRFFVKEENGFRVCKEIREMIIFAAQNIITDPPFTKLDILTCRNLLIYLDSELQKKLIPIFHYSLKSKGILLLGNAETVGSNVDLFSQLDGKSRLYKRLDVTAQPADLNFPGSFLPDLPNIIDKPKVQKSEESLQSAAEQIVLSNHSPAAVLVNDKGDILYINGKTGNYLEPAAGKVNWNIFAMIREELQPALTEAFWKALREKSSVSIKNASKSADKKRHFIKLTVQYINEHETLMGMLMIVFAEQEKYPAACIWNKTLKNESHAERLKYLEQEIMQARRELQITREEMQFSQEELKSRNEELQSTNEELQSAIEELTTSKEEMQSVNEELHTVNTELQSKMEYITNVNNDMKNLLDITQIATIFLDNNLNIRRFTNQATKIIKLIPRDVGRSITDIASNLIYNEMNEDFSEVIKSHGLIEKQVPTNDGRWFLVRIMPYNTLENITDGLVITFLDISILKEMEMELRQKEERYFGLNQEFKSNRYEFYKNIIENIETPVFSVDKQYQYTGFNKNYAILMKKMHGIQVKIGDKLLPLDMTTDIGNIKSKIEKAFSGEAQIDYVDIGYINTGHLGTGYIDTGNGLSKYYYYKVFYTPIRDKDAHISEVMVFSVDLGEQKRDMESVL